MAGTAATPRRATCTAARRAPATRQDYPNGIDRADEGYAEGFDILRNAVSRSCPRPSVTTSTWPIASCGGAAASSPPGAGPDRGGAHRQPRWRSTAASPGSGEGRWTIETAIAEAVPADVLAASLFARFRSRQEHTFAERVLSAMRHGFGGHREPPKAVRVGETPKVELVGEPPAAAIKQD